jgi:hypothetical protein
MSYELIMKLFEKGTIHKSNVLLSLPKHLYRFVAEPFNGAAEMLRQAQQDKRFGKIF